MSYEWFVLFLCVFHVFLEKQIFLFFVLTTSGRSGLSDFETSPNAEEKLANISKEIGKKTYPKVHR